MYLAYLILAHKNPVQVKRLIKRLSCPNVSFFLHLDKKAEDIDSYLTGNPLVHLIKNRVDVRWGAFSVIQATINSLEELLASGVPFDYLNLLSGQDYPIKNNQYIMEFFERGKGSEYMYYDIFPTYDLPDGGMDRIEYYYDYDCGCMPPEAYELEMKSRLAVRPLIPGMRPFHGSQWWSLSRECVTYTVNAFKTNTDIENFYRYSKFPDEQVFQTIVMNSPFAQKTVNNNLRYISWPSAVLWAKNDWKVKPPHPKVLGTKDLSRLISSKALFARKFDMEYDPRILNMIDQLLSR